MVFKYLNVIIFIIILYYHFLLQLYGRIYSCHPFFLSFFVRISGLISSLLLILKTFRTQSSGPFLSLILHNIVRVRVIYLYVQYICLYCTLPPQKLTKDAMTLYPTVLSSRRILFLHVYLCSMHIKNNFIWISWIPVNHHVWDGAETTVDLSGNLQEGPFYRRNSCRAACSMKACHVLLVQCLCVHVEWYISIEYSGILPLK